MCHTVEYPVYNIWIPVRNIWLRYLHDPDKAEGVDDEKAKQDEDNAHDKESVEVGITMGVMHTELLVANRGKSKGRHV
jgi:hypothetical protein